VAGDLTVLSNVDFKDLCVAADVLEGIHSRRSSNNVLESAMGGLLPMLTEALKPKGYDD
jgi:hypothetical protein